MIDGWFLAATTTPTLQVLQRPEQQELCQARLAQLLMLAYRCDLTPGVLVRALGPALHGDHRAAALEQNRSLYQHILTPELFQHLQRVLQVGAPHRLVEHSSWENREAFISAGNHGSAQKGAALLDDCANKDERNLHALALPAWINRFIPHLQCSPMAVLEKEGKSPRPIFDGSFRPGLDYFSVNDATDVTDEWVITYGSAAASYLRWIWNLRITYPQEPIYQYFDDVKSAFRHILLHPDVVGAHGSRTERDVLMLALAAVFGKTDSPPEYMICANARAALAETLQSVGKDLLDPPYAFELTLPWLTLPSERPFVSAEACALNEGVLSGASLRERKLTPHHPFVDDTCLADIRSQLPHAIHASLQSLFMTLGYPQAGRTEALSVEKFGEVQCAEVQTQLGVLVDTRAMTISLPEKKFDRISSLLQKTWHPGRKQFRPLEAARLLGLLRHACVAAWWGKYTFLALQTQLNLALRRECARQRTLLEKNRPPDAPPLTARERDAFYRKWRSVLREVEHSKSDRWLMSNNKQEWPMGFRVNWKKMAKCNISKDLREELNFLTYLFKDPQRRFWKTPIAQSVLRMAHFHAYSDASLEGLGAVCIHLRFLMRLSIRQDVYRRTKRFIDGGPDLITINELELAAGILAFAAVRLAVMQGRHENCSAWPVLQLWLDNITARKFINKGTTNSPRARALLRILALLTRGSPVSLNAEFVPGVENVIADALSRSASSFDNHPSHAFNAFFSEFPQTRGFDLYQPSSALISAIWYALLEGRLPARLLQRTREQRGVDAAFLGRFVEIEV